MTIRIEISHGSQFASEADRQRAHEAAISALAGVDASAASDEYDRQVEISLGDTSNLTGLAEVWDRAVSAANIALTRGWHDTDGAYCEVIAE